MVVTLWSSETRKVGVRWKWVFIKEFINGSNSRLSQKFDKTFLVLGRTFPFLNRCEGFRCSDTTPRYPAKVSPLILKRLGIVVHPYLHNRQIYWNKKTVLIVDKLPCMFKDPQTIFFFFRVIKYKNWTQKNKTNNNKHKSALRDSYFP